MPFGVLSKISPIYKALLGNAWGFERTFLSPPKNFNGNESARKYASINELSADNSIPSAKALRLLFLYALAFEVEGVIETLKGLLIILL